MNATATLDQTMDGTLEQEPAAETDLSKDKVFHLLQNERRRNVLRYMQDVDEAVRMRDVAEQVAAWEHDTTVQALTSDERQRVYIPLYQNHLPKLSDAGIIEYNQSRGIVEPTDAIDDLNRYLEAAENGEAAGATDAATGDSHPWPQYYLSVSAIGALLLASTSVDAFSVPGLGAFAIGVVILALYAALTTVHMVVGE